MISYKLTDNEKCLRKLLNNELTNDFVTTDNLDYLQWLEAGNIPLPAYTEEELQERNKQAVINSALQLLSSTDWTQTLDNLNNRGQEWITKWATYRSELRKVVNEERDTLPKEIV